MKILQSLTLGVAGVALAACSPDPSDPSAGGAQAGCMTRAYDTIGGPISLTAHTGERVTEADFKGAPTLIYFGFTYCPDICPGTLVAVNRAYDALPATIEAPQTLLITVDPERDTPKIVGDSVGLGSFWVLLALMVASELFGFLGVLLALPAAAVIKIGVVRGLARYRASAFFGPDDDDPGPRPRGPPPADDAAPSEADAEAGASPNASAAARAISGS